MLTGNCGPNAHQTLSAATLVRQNAKRIAEIENQDYIMTDGPPCIGCPVIGSLSGGSLALLVAEPALSAIHDLERVVGVCRHFGVPCVVCVNKYDLNEENTWEIETYRRGEETEVVAKNFFRQYSDRVNRSRFAGGGILR